MIPRVDNFGGWRISGPYTTGRRWIAQRWGVQLSNSTYEGLIEMIRLRREDERAERAHREGHTA